MEIAVWIVQILLALAFLLAGVIKAFRYGQAQTMMSWVKDVPHSLVTFIGIAEILGAVGLILPAATGILPWLTPLAAAALIVVMVLGAGLHIQRGETNRIAGNIVLLLLAAFVLYAHLTVLPA